MRPEKPPYTGVVIKAGNTTVASGHFGSVVVKMPVAPRGNTVKCDIAPIGFFMGRPPVIVNAMVCAGAIVELSVAAITTGDSTANIGKSGLACSGCIVENHIGKGIAINAKTTIDGKVVTGSLR